MNQKIISYKFSKKGSESHEKINKSKKNYENIFNDILNRKNIDNPDCKNIINESLQNKNQLNKKNKIKYISKVDNSNGNEGIKENIDNYKLENKFLDKKKKNIASYMILNEIKNIKDKNVLSYNDLNNFGINNDYMNKSKVITGNYRKTLNQHFDNKPIYTHQNSNSHCSKKKNNIIFIPQNSEKSRKEQRGNKSVKKYNKINLTKNEIDKENNKPFNVVKVRKKYELDFSDKNILLNSKISNVNNKKQTKNKIAYKKYEYGEKKEKKIPSYKIKNLIYKDFKKKNHFNYVNKIAITNDDLDKNSNINNNINSYNNRRNKIKNLRINKSNLNININLTNFSEKVKKSNLICEHNYNITKTNLLNNKNFTRKNTNDYHLPFYNYSSNKKLSNLNHIISKGIKIQSININLGDDNNNDNKFNRKNNNFKNKDNGNFIFLSENNLKSKEIDLDKKETQSEYDHLNDYEDFWSNRSMTANSCKSGFTASTRLRSLSKERDKIKLLNKIRKKNENDMERIGDKLLNIVSNFHKISNDFKHNKKSDNRLNKIKNKYKL